KVQVVQILLAQVGVNSDTPDQEGRTSLSWTAGSGEETTWIWLLLSRQYVDSNTKAKGGKTPLCCTARKAHEEVVSVLLEREDVEPHVRDEYGHTLLTWAQTMNNPPTDGYNL
ncbi:hypothetical protein EV426DRAFT_534358, partial [Tirmania nivea]